MDNPTLELISVVVIIFSGYSIVILNKWYWLLIALSAQYLGAFVLVSGVWRIELAVVKLVAGWMSTAIIGATQLDGDYSKEENETWPMRRLFGFFVGGFFVLLAFSLASRVYELFPDFGYYQILGGVLLLCLGVLKLGLSNFPVQIVFGLLVVFSGFEILFAAAEDSVMVAGLLAVINLGLAVVGAYLYHPPEWNEDGDVL